MNKLSRLLACGAVALLPWTTSAFAGPIGAVTSSAKISQTSGGFTGDLDLGDEWGLSITVVGDLNNDGVPDLAVGTRRDDDGGTLGLDSNTGAVWILFMNADGSVASHQKISESQGGLSVGLIDGDQFGSALASLGDLDADGVEDIAVGSQGFDGNNLDTGAVYILFLNANGTVKSSARIDYTSGLTPNVWQYDNMGTALSALGDLDDDGVKDLAIGAGASNGALPGNSGVVYIVFLNADGSVKGSQSIGNGLGGFTGTLEELDEFGVSLAGVGDLDGDGIEDLLVGAHQDDDGGFDRGAVYILFLNANGTVDSMQKISAISGGLPAGLQDADRFGTAVALVGDLDGPGGSAITIAVGAAQADDAGVLDTGVVWVVRLGTTGAVVDAQRVSPTRGCGPALEAFDYFGQAMATLGDHDGDGTPDVLVGAVGDDDGNLGAGAIYLLHLDGEASVCGDEVVSCDECCDVGASNGTPGSGCSSTCQCDPCLEGESCCGNGTIESPEECDDGNTVDGDCCSYLCELECPDDGNPCTRDCDPADGMCNVADAPSTGCRIAGRSGLGLKADPKGKVQWKWSKGENTYCDDVGAPNVDTDYDICIWDGSGSGTYTLESRFHVPAGPLWTERNCDWTYDDKTGAADGITKIRIKSGEPGRSSIGMAAREPKLPLTWSPPTPLSLTEFMDMNSNVVVQMHNSLGVCWESEFTEAKKNTGAKFRTNRLILLTQ